MRAKIFSILAVALLGFIVWAQPTGMTPERKLIFAEQIISNYYVDEIDTSAVVKEAIIGMLKTLDPHSTYTDPEETKALTEPLEGNFSGIGIRFQMTRDTVYVIEVITGGPSEKLGLLPGDLIISCNDTILSGQERKNSDILKNLRGPKGSVAKLKVKRKGEAKPMEFRVTRDDIPLYSIDASYMVNDSVGYISLARFAATTTDEFKDAMRTMRKKGMKHVIIDLTNNGGGYLRPATELANIFLQKGDLLVYTDSPKNGTTRYVAEEDGTFLDGRVVVMMNQFSASASEILAGALKDNDRAVITGRRSFGKGLVQRPFPFPDGSMMRLTVSRYYTPSGRCIQKPYTMGEEDTYKQDLEDRLRSGEYTSADSIHFADSTVYYTLRLNRPVYGGGGIVPDHFVPLDTTMNTAYYRELVAKGVFNNYCLGYVDDRRAELQKSYKTPESFLKKFQVTDQMLEELVELGMDEGIEYDKDQFAQSATYIRKVIKGLIGRDLFTQEVYFRVVNEVNPIYVSAVDIANDPAHYRKHLSVNKQ